MSSITQTIPSYTGGISQQPDELKLPGQVSKAKNVYPDLVNGLTKRPGGKLIKSLSDGSKNSVTNGRWFHYYRDENEQYIGQIATNGVIKMWTCTDIYDTGGVKRHDAGDEMNVTYPAAVSSQSTLTTYLTHTDDEDIQTLTLNDYTYVTNRTKTVAMSGTVEPARPAEAYIELKKVSYASQYAVNLFNDNTTTATSTATRISVELIKSSNNYCDGTGHMVGRAARLGSSGRCDDSAGDGRDAWAPNVATRIFSINDGASVTDTGAVSGDYTYTIDVKDSGNNSVNRGTDLYFRIATIGQSVPFTSGSGDSQSTTYQARYTTTHDMLYGGSGWQQGDYFHVWMKDAYYKITIDEVSVSQIQGNLGIIRPTPTSFDTKTTVTAESILGDLEAGIAATSEFTSSEVKIIGNGIYLTNGSAFNISSPTGDLLNVFTDEVNNIEDLPTQCKHGYVVKVKNSTANEDDYYVKFFGKNNRDGVGVWEECAAPGRTTTIDSGTMPIQIVRNYVSNAVRFDVDHIVWDACPVGNTTTVPEPSFINQKINKMVFFRNRMVMLSDENVIMSQPGDFYNFWPRSAITYSATDVIDLSCSSEYPAIVYDAIQVNSGLVIFTKNQQFMLTTDSDVLSPQTAKINALASYNFNYKTNPISLGTTIAFLDNAGKHTRFWEVAKVLREGEPIVVDQSKVVPKLFDKELELVSNSRENGVIFFSKKGTNTLYGYKYFNTSEKRLQQAWFTWELMGDIQHHAVLDDALYVVVRNNSKDVLQKFSLKKSDGEREITDNNETTDTILDDITYRIHLDNSTEVASSDLTYDATNNWTKFNLPTGFNLQKSGTYTRSAKVITVTLTGHNYLKGQSVIFSPTAGNATAGTYEIQTVPSANTFTIEDSESGTISSTTCHIYNNNLAVYVVPSASDLTFQGRTENVFTFIESGTVKIKLPGNWKTYDPQFVEDGSTADDVTPANNIILGYQFDMEVEFPTIHYAQAEGESYRALLNANLIIHRVKLNFGANGLYSTVLDRVGKPSYTETWEPTIANQYGANRVQINEQSTQTIPAYEKNTNFTLTLKSTHPTPATLYSMTWEGVYTNNNYKRV